MDPLREAGLQDQEGESKNTKRRSWLWLWIAGVSGKASHPPFIDTWSFTGGQPVTLQYQQSRV